MDNPTQKLVLSQGADLPVIQFYAWDDTYSESMKDRHFDIPERQFLNSQSPDLFIDVGAHIGLYSVIIAIGNPDCQVVSFEPHPLIYERLVQNAALNELGNVTTHNLGVWSSYEPLTFNAVPDPWARKSSFEHTRWDSTPIQINCVTLDDYFRNTKGKTKVLLKIDANSGEHHVIKGGLQFIQKHKPTIILKYDTKTIPDAPFQAMSLLPDYQWFLIDGKTKYTPAEKVGHMNLVGYPNG